MYINILCYNKYFQLQSVAFTGFNWRWFFVRTFLLPLEFVIGLRWIWIKIGIFPLLIPPNMEAPFKD